MSTVPSSLMPANSPCRFAAGSMVWPSSVVVAQIALGLAAYAAKVAAPVAASAPWPVVLVVTGHQALGAAVFATSVVTAALVWKAASTAPAPVGIPLEASA